MSFRINSQRFRAEHFSAAAAQLADRGLKIARAVKDLHTEVQCIQREQIGSVEPQVSGKVELAICSPTLADSLQHTPLHVHHENLVAPGIRNIDSLGCGVHGDARGVFEEAFPIFQASDNPAEFSTRIKYKDLPQ